jgi:hypothetical protein
MPVGHRNVRGRGRMPRALRLGQQRRRTRAELGAILEFAMKVDPSFDAAKPREDLEHLTAMLTNLVRRCEA